MIVYIVRNENEFSIIKVSDLLIDNFLKSYSSQIVVSAKDIQGAIIQFSEIEKPEDFKFNPELIKYKNQAFT